MPMISLPLIPSAAALAVFLVISFEENDTPELSAFLTIFISGFVYFAIYGLCTAIGL
jgi:hypothetical protein